ncbi:MAG TPA: DUF5655 domain-containing protein [Longimicrobiaceae bacterium]|nr:DUF5655 domain-containing protein [Longimicrobiaceae bacterium]
MTARPLWHCPACGRPFASHGQPHSCVVATVEQHLAGKGAPAAALYHRFAGAVEACGPVMLAPAKTRIGFQVRMIFSAVTVRRDRLDAHVVLARRLEHPRFRKVESISPRNHVHHFRIRAPEEVDAEVMEWLREAYAVGEQKHLAR